ncbi:MAG: hypothetical protein ACSHYB_03680 [Roseibacillus sp.]
MSHFCPQKGARKDLTTAEDLATRYPATNGLIVANLNLGINATLPLLTEDPGDQDPVPLIQAILAHGQGAEVLTKRLTGLTLHPEVKARVAAFHHRSGQLPSDLAALFTVPTAAGTSLSASLQAEDRAALAADVLQLGDPYRGEDIYRRPALACTNCHAIGSAGAQIGPNLATIGSSAPADYMVQSILEPSAAIAEHYENTLITLKDGSVRMGVISSKSNNEVLLMDSAQGGKEVRLQADQIVKEEGLPSLMPAGLADLLENRQEFLDLTKFLSVLGQPGDFANDESPVIRKWQLLPAPAEPTDSKLPTKDAPWQTAYSKVNGTLPATDFPKTESKTIYARATIEVLTPGPVLLNFSDGETFSLKPSSLNLKQSLRLWLNRSEIKDLSAPLNLEKGRHEFLFHRDKKSNLRLEFTTPAGSSIKLQPEGGV